MDRKKKSILELTNCSLEEYKNLTKLPLRILADNVRSMHNIGALFRTADAFRVDEIILAGISGIPPHPEIAKSALGAEDSVNWRHVDNALSETSRLQSQGWLICALEQTHNSIPLHTFHLPTNTNPTNNLNPTNDSNLTASNPITTSSASNPSVQEDYPSPIEDFSSRSQVSSPKLLLVIGNEVKGVNQQIIDIADFILEIPQEGTKHSLNVSTSAAIALHHLYLLLKQ